MGERMSLVRDVADRRSVQGDVPSPRPDPPIPSTWLTSWSVAAVPAVLLAYEQGATTALLVAAVCTGMTVTLRRLTGTVAVALALIGWSVVTVAIGGRMVLLSVGLGALLAHRLRSDGRRIQSGADLGLALVGAIAGITIVAGRPTDAGVVVTLQLAALVVSAADESVLGRLERVGAGMRTAVDRMISATGAALFAAVGVFLVAVPWAAQRVLRVDPLTPRRPVEGWLTRHRLATRAGSAWLRDPTEGRAGVALGARRGGAALLQLAVVAAVVAVPIALVDSDDPPPDRVPVGAVDEPWWPEYQATLSWLNIPGPGNAYDPIGPDRLRDLTSRYINVENGARTTWHPPACDGCPRLTVWMYGGSTTFGIGQRDEYTIPSELAKLAAERGMTLDVRNRGVPADLHWEEAQRLAWDAAVEPPPDLVIFLDGTNEMWSSRAMNDRGLGAEIIQWNPETENARRQYQQLIPSAPGFFDPPKPAGVQVRSDDGSGGSPLGTGELAGATVERYLRARESSEAAALRHDVEVLWFWQPCADTVPLVPGESGHLGDRREEASRLCTETSSLLAGQVIDLTHALDERTTALFFDPFHTNELGARYTAQAILDRSIGVLQDLGGRNDGG